MRMLVRVKGSATSGNWGHAGRPGKLGGSAKRSVAMSRISGPDWQKRQEAKLKPSTSQMLERGQSTNRNSGKMASTYRKEFLPWTKEVRKKKQAKAIKDYTEEGYEDINRHLRTRTGQDLRSSYTWSSIEDIDAALDSAPRVKADTVIYRGVSAKRIESYKEGDVYQDNAFVSTSVDLNSSFAGGDYARMDIILPKGSKAGAYVAKLSGQPIEKEWLMPRGSRFEILKKTVAPADEGGHEIFTLLYLGAEPGTATGGKAFKQVSENRAGKFIWKTDDLVLVKRPKKKIKDKKARLTIFASI